MRRFASCAGVALFNGRARQDLRDFAYTDSLTGLASRRWLDRQLASPRDTKLSLLLIDFDGLKPVNDLLGYDRGDLLIAAVGATIAANLEEGELAARLGGDEFVVLLPETGKKRAALRAEQLTQILDDLKLPDDIAGLFLGASVGAATAKPHEDPQRALNRAGVEMRSRKRRRRSDREDPGRLGGEVEESYDGLVGRRARRASRARRCELFRSQALHRVVPHPVRFGYCRWAVAKGEADCGVPATSSALGVRPPWMGLSRQHHRAERLAGGGRA